MPQKRAKGEGVHVALLRGINVGGKNMVPIAELVALLEETGCREVRSYIQSGNFVFQAASALAGKLSPILAAQIRKQYGIEVPVVLRTAAEIDAVSKSNPYLAAGEDAASLHVAFLADTPPANKVSGLDPQRSPPDRFEVQGRDIYLCLPNGVARTKLTNAYFDSRLATTSTLRNWRTVLRLVEMTQE